MFKIIVLIERLFAQFLGKGWGAATIASEVKFCLLTLKNKDNPIVFDVGANVGNWSATFCSKMPNSIIVLFEPSLTNIEKLLSRFPELNLETNYILDGTKYLMPFALASFASE